MAIKKGAFDLYVNQRQLPKKENRDTTKKKHFFDDVMISSDDKQNELQSLISQNELPILENEYPSAQTLILDNDATINGSQSVHNRFTAAQSDNIDVLIKQKSLPNKEQKNSSILDHGHVLKGALSFNKLVGTQRNIIISLYKNIKMNGSNTTEELTLEHISFLSGVNIKSLKNTLFRLRSTGLIINADQKAGRGGWVRYSLHNELFKQISEANFLIGQTRK